MKPMYSMAIIATTEKLGLTALSKAESLLYKGGVQSPCWDAFLDSTGCPLSIADQNITFLL